MALNLLFVGALVVLSSSCVVQAGVADNRVDIQAERTEEGYSVHVRSLKESRLVNLKKPDGNVLSENVHILNVDVNEDTGEFKYSKWVPSSDELNRANDVLIDSEMKAVLKVSPGISQDKPTVVSGVLSDVAIVHDGSSHLAVPMSKTHSDYIDLHRNFSGVSSFKQAGQVNAIVEIVIVCDKEFGDVFGHDNQRILEYWTVYMWDLNLRYKTLPSDNISFRVNGIVVISSFAAQPFIEEARAPDGRAEFGRILDKYAGWVYSQRDSMPKHDLAPLATNTALEWGGGLAYMNAACWVDHTNGRDVGTAVFNDGGSWGSVTVATHELGHNLGAPHDDDGNFPGGCDQRGFIMGGGTDDRRYFFSECSDRTVSSFVRSDGAACLQRIDEGSSPVIDPSYSSVKAPTMDEMCKRALNSDEAHIAEEDTFDCKTMRCRRPDESGQIWIHFRAPVENIVCGAGSGRCFRGVCRPGGYMFKNEGSGLCMVASDPFAFTATANMKECPLDGTPLERFVTTSSPNGNTLATPFLSNRNEESGEKCLYTGNSDGGAIWTDRCNADNPWHGWDFQDAGNGRFLLAHRVTGRCAKPQSRNAGSVVETWADCNASDEEMLWTRFL